VCWIRDGGGASAVPCGHTIARMAHPLVDQLRFTRSEWLRGLEGVPEADGIVRLEPMNSISWIVYHMAWHEQLNFLTRLQGQTPVPEAIELAATGGPASTPPLADALAAWHTITRAGDAALDRLDTAAMESSMPDAPTPRTIGSTLLRVTYHYWSHIGEISAIRQMLGHDSPPEFVGAIDTEAPYRSA
jgi:DinB family protein